MIRWPADDRCDQQRVDEGLCDIIHVVDIVREDLERLEGEHQEEKRHKRRRHAEEDEEPAEWECERLII